MSTNTEVITAALAKNHKRLTPAYAVLPINYNRSLYVKTRNCLLALALLLLPMLAAADEASSYIEQYRKNENVCLQLNRGKMIMLRNNHASRDIEYRMVRMLAEVRQGGLTVGILQPGPEGQALGCEKIDGLQQKWELIRARFSNSN